MTGGVVKKLPTTAEEVKQLSSGVVEGIKNYAINEAKRIGMGLIKKKGGEFLSKLSGGIITTVPTSVEEAKQMGMDLIKTKGGEFLSKLSGKRP